MLPMHDVILRPDQQIVLDRFMNACQQDDRVIAAFLGGSNASGTSDAYSDLDINLITSDVSFDDFWDNRITFMRKLGEPAFMENFGTPNIVCYILDNGVEGDLVIGRESQFETIHTGPYRVLLDKKDILKGAVFNRPPPDPDDQIETLRRMITWFWHDWVHFTTALRRGQLWWAQGQLEMLRGYCISLLRLQNDFSDHEAGDEPYFKIEKAISVEQLSRLEATFGPLERRHLYQAGKVVAGMYKDLAPSLAHAHGISYPLNLEMVLMKRLEPID